MEREFGLKDKSLESLRDRASGFAGMVAAFCQRMKFTQLELLIAKFQVSHNLATLQHPLERLEMTVPQIAQQDCFTIAASLSPQMHAGSPQFCLKQYHVGRLYHPIKKFFAVDFRQYEQGLKLEEVNSCWFRRECSTESCLSW